MSDAAKTDQQVEQIRRDNHKRRDPVPPGSRRPETVTEAPTRSVVDAARRRGDALQRGRASRG